MSLFSLSSFFLIPRGKPGGFLIHQFTVIGDLLLIIFQRTEVNLNFQVTESFL